VIRGRINGELAVARSFGDFFYKEDEVEVSREYSEVVRKLQGLLTRFNEKSKLLF